MRGQVSERLLGRLVAPPPQELLELALRFTPPAAPPDRSFQNTDPMVFGDAFIYSNCVQPAFRSLRSLSPGSIILFGRYGGDGRAHSFSLDTCLVVDQVRRLAPAGDGWGRDLSDAVLLPLSTEGAVGDLTVYFGRRGPAGPFSFSRHGPGSRDAFFAHPALEPVGALTGVVSSVKNQGIKVSAVTTTGRDAIWDEIATSR